MLTLLSSGSNAHGQLGNGAEDDSHIFQPCIFDGYPASAMPPSASNILEIANGANHTLILLECVDGQSYTASEVWGSGDGRLGQLGPSYQHDTLAGTSTRIFRKVTLPLELEDLTGFSCKHVCSTWETSFLVFSCEGKSDVLISMGSYDFGALGVEGKGKKKAKNKAFHVVKFDHLLVSGSRVDPASLTIHSIAAGQRHVIVLIEELLKDGSRRRFLVGWGAARHGELGNDMMENKKAPTFHSLPTLVFIDDPRDPIVNIALGFHHTVFRHSSGRLLGLGSNRKSQLENISSLQRVHRVDCTWNGTYSIVEDDEGYLQVVATGSNTHGQLGQGTAPKKHSNPHPQSSPVHFSPSSYLRRLTSISCGSEHCLVSFSVRESSDDSSREPASEVWGWGWNEHGNLGDGSTVDAPIPKKIWAEAEQGKLIGIWGGNGTSWICFRKD
ncbi:regulator of chromosome condensation 1/beta-lactamase-inhibitor protein II [Cyathus striatus]|nr:regulator of chromosome condensation 1/beta-lactamase-inhibitor protein II [Cyathus striatus]